MKGEFDCCESCLRRSQLIGRLAPRIGGLLGRRAIRPAGLLALGEDELVAAVGEDSTGATRRLLAGFDVHAARLVLESAGAHAYCLHSPGYPSALLALGDPPAVLYVRGEAGGLHALAASPAATVVGTRRPSAHGLEVAHGLGRGLSAAGVTVVSGLALGIDAEAHRGALEAGAGVVAVLACGADVPYPRANRDLYDEIVRRGAVVSELPPGVPPMKWSFPARNRIMAALGGITVVVEAAEPSGSLITAAHATDLDRPVGAVPGHVTAGRAAGGNRLLRDGAAVIRGAADVLDELFGVSGRAGELPIAVADSSLEPDLRQVLDEVEQGASVAAIAEATGLAPAKVRSSLGRLELMGLICRAGLASYVRTVA